jgi:hypothetical protein
MWQWNEHSQLQYFLGNWFRICQTLTNSIKLVFSSFLTKKLTYHLLSAEPHLGASASATKADSLCPWLQRTRHYRG